MQSQFYLYFNRIGDVFTMISLAGALQSSACLLFLYLIGKPNIQAELIILPVYGVLNTVIGLLLLIENFYYKFSKRYLILAVLAKLSGVVMLFDFCGSYRSYKKCMNYQRIYEGRQTRHK